MAHFFQKDMCSLKLKFEHSNIPFKAARAAKSTKAKNAVAGRENAGGGVKGAGDCSEAGTVKDPGITNLGRLRGLPATAKLI